MTWYENETVLSVKDQVAREYARRFKHLLEYDDVDQELNVWCIKHAHAIDQHASLDHFEAWLRTGLRSAAVDHLNQMRRQTSDDYRDQVTYAKSQIQALLPVVFDESRWVEPPVSENGGGRSYSDPATGGNYLVQVLDVSRAYNNLPVFYQDLVKLRYFDEWSISEIATDANKAQSTISYHLDRGIDLMYEFLGGTPKFARLEDDDTEIVGRRKALSNSAAQALISMTYEGDNT